MPNDAVVTDVVAHLDDGRTSMVFLAQGAMPTLAHWGSSLGPDAIDARAFERPVPHGGLDTDVPVGLLAEAGAGWFGRPGLEGHRADGADFAPRFDLVDVATTSTSARFGLSDPIAGLDLAIAVELHPSGVARFDVTLANTGSDPYHLDGLRLCLPVSDDAREVLTVGGRHTNEFGRFPTPWERSCITVENRHGKTSHERLGAVFVGTPGFGEQQGQVWGCHLGWSGNYELICDAVTDGRRVVQAGELFGSGETVLAPGERYDLPPVYAVHSPTGLDAMSGAFHRYLRDRPNHPRLPRPVLLNTWEAVYFDHDFDRLTALAEAAAECGIERFVLDDGWFHGRRNDRAGLGDWWVDDEVWPRGLAPLIERVRGLGMEFGIWVEPEMVNPDSELQRQHPDWVLADRRYPDVLGRHQLVLDLGRDDVRDHVFARLDALLADHDIAAVKWDHNRDLVAPATAAPPGGGGRYAVGRQTRGAYELLDRLRAAHPSVEIESCASGGGRADFGILERTDRVWTSDSIDALDRVEIQRGFSLLFPPELMGSHIGSPVTHVTGRRHELAFRAASALFGSLGIEWNLLEAGPEDRARLAEVIAVHKRFRDLLHRGRAVRTDHPDPTVDVHGVVAVDQREALVAVTRVRSGPSHHTAAVRLPGLDDDVRYGVTWVPIADQSDVGKSRRRPLWLTEGLTMTGNQLRLIGFQAPVLSPETTMLIHIAAMTTTDTGPGADSR